jgi:hypothetical protein
MRGSAKTFRPDDSFCPKKPSRMDVKIVLILASERSGTQTMLKCLNNLGETAFLPPPGGAQAQMNLVS